MKTLCDHQFIVGHDDDEKIDIKLFENADDADDAVAAPDMNETVSSSQNTMNCRICMDAPSNVLFIKCRHLKICNDCYRMLYKNEKEKYNQMINDFYTDENGVMTDIEEIPSFFIKCPYCREEHEKRDVIIDIFL